MQWPFTIILATQKLMPLPILWKSHSLKTEYPSHNRCKAGHLFYQLLLHLKQAHSNDLTNQLYQVQTWNCKPEIQIHRKYMYSIPAMLKESAVTILRFSEERMYDHTEKYLMTITRKFRKTSKQRTKKISNIRDTYICSKSTII